LINPNCGGATPAAPPAKPFIDFPCRAFYQSNRQAHLQIALPGGRNDSRVWQNACARLPYLLNGPDASGSKDATLAQP
jgi:hypothetical protein